MLIKHASTVVRALIRAQYPQGQIWTNPHKMTVGIKIYRSDCNEYNLERLIDKTAKALNFKVSFVYTDGGGAIYRGGPAFIVRIHRDMANSDYCRVA